MAVEMIREPRYMEIVRITMDFRYRDMPSAGIGVALTLEGKPVEWTCYEADEDVPNGKLTLCKGHGQPLGRVAEDSLLKALNGERGLYLHQVEVYQGRDVEPGEGRCSCGGTVVLADYYDNECSRQCGRTYAKAGWEMAPPWQRGEEIAYGMEDEALEVERLEAAYNY